MVLPVGAALLVIAALGTWMAVGSWKRNDELQRLVASGTTLEAQGDQAASKQSYEQAQAAYHSAWTLDRGSAPARDGLARVNGRLEAVAQAEAEAMRLLEAGRPALDQAQRYLYDPDANYEELQKRVEAGKKLIEEAIRRAPQVALGHYLLGKAWRILGWQDKAEACWREASRLDASLGQAHFQLGMMFLERAIIAKALQSPGESIQELGELSGSMLADARRELELAEACPWEEEDEVSKELLRVAAACIAEDRVQVIELGAAAMERLGPREGCERFYVMVALGLTGDERREALDLAIMRCPHDELATILRVDARRKGGDIDGAIADFDRVIAINPRNAAAFNDRGTARHMKGDRDGAIADFDRAIAIDPGNADASSNRCIARTRKGDIDGAIRDLDHVLILNPRTPKAFYNRGCLRSEKGDHDGAIADYDEAIGIEPRFANAFINRGNSRFAKGDFDGAIADSSQAIAISPGDTVAFANRGAARIAKGDLDGAILDLDHAIAIDASSCEAFKDRGKAREGKRDIEGAIEDYTSALKFAAADWEYRKQVEDALRAAREKRGK